ncbi:hypothetical protein HK405_001531 [Cladochytrium tenue]|nr:hypothetical protein HK405_001531 [Cladochytrium tenue]
MEAMFYLTGAAMFLYHVPERWAPGRFDYWGQSHQIFHVAIVAGAWCHRAALFSSIEWWKANGDRACALASMSQP